MRQRTGITSVMVLAVAAGAGWRSYHTAVVQEPAPREMSRSAPQTKIPAAPAQARAGRPAQLQIQALDAARHRALHDGPCADLEEKLKAFFALDTEAAPPSCYEAPRPSDAGLSNQQASTSHSRSENSKVPVLVPPADLVPPALAEKTQRMDFVIAILPDPLHTHFSLTFDRFATAIEQGAQDEQFEYDTSWLPWETEEVTYSSLDDNLRADDRKKAQEDQPGILLFRRGPPKDAPETPEPDAYDRGLGVFVVGEEATGGIHRTQFQQALKWLEILQPRAADLPPPQLRIIGPTFTGSLPSLVQLLDGRSATVLSGSVSGRDAVLSMKAQLKNLQRTQFPSMQVNFHSFSIADREQVDDYCQYLRDGGMRNPQRIAVISEDETRYGASLAQLHSPESPQKNSEVGCTAADDSGEMAHVVNLYYPRDISALRAAYQSQSLFSTNAPSSASTDVVHRSLKTDIADPEGKQHDTIRAYSGTQTALSQESELQQLVRMLRSNHIDYIVLRSSNPLDQIFLTHFLLEQYPAGRIVVTSADLLLARDMEASGVNGIMTLSTYPLLPAQQDWTAGGGSLSAHSHRAFTNTDAEGTYIATRFLLGNARDPG